MSNQQAGTIQPLPLTASLLRRYPVAKETFEMNVKAQLQGTYFTDEEWIDGEFFLTDLRIGAVGFASEPVYYLAPIEDLRHIGMSEEENILYLRYVSSDQPAKKEDDIYIRVRFEAEVDLFAVYSHVHGQRIDRLRADTRTALTDVGRDIYERRYDSAVVKLDRLLAIEPMNDLLHLLKSRTLNVSGKRVEGVSFGAKHFASQDFFNPDLMLFEYMWYEWHDGALRLLPDWSGLTGESRALYESILRAITAKSAGDHNQFVLHACKALRIAFLEGEHIKINLLFICSIKLLHYLKTDTRPLIEALFHDLQRQVDQMEHDDEVSDELVEFIRLFFSIPDDSNAEQLFDWYEGMYALFEKSEDDGDRIITYMYREQYDRISNYSVKPKSYSPPEEWQLDAFIFTSDLWTDGRTSAHLEVQVTRTWADARINGVTSTDIATRLSQIKQGNWSDRLKAQDQEYLVLLVTLLQTEIAIRRGEIGEAFGHLARWKKDNYRNIGRFDDPWFKYAGEVIDYYSAWAVNSESNMREALARIPNRNPFCWLHREAESAFEAIKRTQLELDGHEAVIGEMRRAVEQANRLVSSSELGTAAIEAARTFSQALLGKLADANDARIARTEVAAASDRERHELKDHSAQGNQTVPNDGLFSKLKSKLFGTTTGKSWPDIKVAEQPFQAKPTSLIRIAIAGESGSGKTTMFNAIFRTNLFFATQEEATGVPTEIRYGLKPLIEVWDSNGSIRKQLDIPADWLEKERTLLLPERLHEVQSFVAEHTRVGSAELDWVERVVVLWPLEGLPEHTVLVDTPGFNANEGRSAIAESVLRECNICLYIMDARNALKGKEIGTLNAIREAAGKTFIILNKMDLVFGDDELDCDGAAAADETIARVRRELAAMFGLDDVIVFPVCSLPRIELPQEAERYEDNLQSLISVVFQEAKDNKLDYLIDASARSALELFREVRTSAAEAAQAGEQELRKLERAVPHDFRLYEEEAVGLLKSSLLNNRNAFFDAMNRNLEQAFGDAVDRFAGWLQQVSSASQLKKEVQAKAEEIVKSTIYRLEHDRNKELERLGGRVAEAASGFMRGLYSNLPFRASYDAKKLVAGLSNLNVSSSGQLSAELSSINYGDGVNGGAAVGVAIGALVLGPIGAIIGGFLGQLFGGKSLGEVKQEVFDSFSGSMEGLWDNVADVLNRDLSEQQTASFLSKLQIAVDKQLSEYKETIRSEIERHQAEWHKKLDAQVELQLVVAELQKTMARLRDWRNVRRARLR